MRIPITVQMQPGENGIAVISSMLGAYGKYVKLSELRQASVTSRNGSTPEQLSKTAVKNTELKNQAYPLVALWKRRYYCIVRRIRGNTVYLMDPAKGNVRVPLDFFQEKYSGILIRMTPGDGFEKGGHRESVFPFIRRRLKGTGPVMIRLAVLNILSVSLNLVMVHATKAMLDHAEGNAILPPGFRMDTYRTLMCLMAGTLTLLTIVNALKTLKLYRTAHTTAAGSGSRLFKKLFGQPLMFFEQYSLAELSQRISGNASLDLSLMRTMIPRALDLIMTVLYIVQMFLYHRQVGVLCLSVELLYIGLSLWMKQAIANEARRMSTSQSSMNSVTLNGLGTIDTIKVGGLERVFFSAWNESQREFQQSRYGTIRLNQYSAMAGNVHTLFSQGCLLFAGAFFMIRGSFTLGMMAALQSILTSLRNSLTNIVQTGNSLQNMRTNLERIEDVENREVRPELPLAGDEPDKFAGELEASHLIYRYNPADPPALDDVSVSVKQGEIVAIVGETGSGKSTLLKCLADFYEPQEGTVLYGGRPRSAIPDVVFHSSVTTVDQEAVMFEDTVAANLTMWDSTIENYEMILAARDAQIHDRILKDRDGYYALVCENGRNFSSGELQRMELARALSMEPTLLFLDEFTSALDALTEEKIFQALRDKGTTCIIAAHRLSTVASCDRIYCMEHGKIAESGTHQELLRLNGLYSRLVNAQEAV